MKHELVVCIMLLMLLFLVPVQSAAPWRTLLLASAPTSKAETPSSKVGVGGFPRALGVSIGSYNESLRAVGVGGKVFWEITGIGDGVEIPINVSTPWLQGCINLTVRYARGHLPVEAYWAGWQEQPLGLSFAVQFDTTTVPEAGVAKETRWLLGNFSDYFYASIIAKHVERTVAGIYRVFAESAVVQSHTLTVLEGWMPLSKHGFFDLYSRTLILQSYYAEIEFVSFWLNEKPCNRVTIRLVTDAITNPDGSYTLSVSGALGATIVQRSEEATRSSIEIQAPGAHIVEFIIPDADFVGYSTIKGQLTAAYSSINDILLTYGYDWREGCPAPILVHRIIENGAGERTLGFLAGYVNASDGAGEQLTELRMYILIENLSVPGDGVRIQVNDTKALSFLTEQLGAELIEGDPVQSFSSVPDGPRLLYVVKFRSGQQGCFKLPPATILYYLNGSETDVYRATTPDVHIFLRKYESYMGWGLGLRHYIYRVAGIQHSVEVQNNTGAIDHAVESQQLYDVRIQLRNYFDVDAINIQVYLRTDSGWLSRYLSRIPAGENRTVEFLGIELSRGLNGFWKTNENILVFYANDTWTPDIPTEFFAITEEPVYIVTPPNSSLSIPWLRVTKTLNVSSIVDLNQAINVTVSVTNEQSGWAGAIDLTEYLPPGVELVSTSGWSQDPENPTILRAQVNLAPSSRESIWYVVRVTSREMLLFATTSAAVQPAPGLKPVLFHSESYLRSSAVTVERSWRWWRSDDPQLQYRFIVNITDRVTNHGNSSIYFVNLNGSYGLRLGQDFDLIAGSVSASYTVLRPGQVVENNFTIAFRLFAANATPLWAAVSYRSGNVTFTGVSSNIVAPALSNQPLSVTKSITPVPEATKPVFQITLVLTSQANVTLREVHVIDPFDPNLWTLLEGDYNTSSPSLGTVEWVLSDVEPGDQRIMTYMLLLSNGTEAQPGETREYMLPSATAEYTPLPDWPLNASSNTVSVTISYPTLIIAKTVEERTTSPDTVLYEVTISIANLGDYTVDNATAVSKLEEHFEFYKAEEGMVVASDGLVTAFLGSVDPNGTAVAKYLLKLKLLPENITEPGKYVYWFTGANVSYRFLNLTLQSSCGPYPAYLQVPEASVVKEVTPDYSDPTAVRYKVTIYVSNLGNYTINNVEVLTALEPDFQLEEFDPNIVRLIDTTIAIDLDSVAPGTTASTSFTIRMVNIPAAWSRPGRWYYNFTAANATYVFANRALYANASGPSAAIDIPHLTAVKEGVDLMRSDAVAYSITVTVRNPGPWAVQQVLISDTPPEGIETVTAAHSMINVLYPDASETLQYEARMNVPGNYSWEAKIVYQFVNRYYEVESNSIWMNVSLPIISVEKIVDPVAGVSIETVFTIAVTVSNHGPTFSVFNVQLNDTLPEGVTLYSGTTFQQVQEVGVDQVYVFTYNITAIEAGYITLPPAKISLSFRGLLLNYTTNSVIVEVAPSLELVKEAYPSRVSVGEAVEVRVRLYNPSNVTVTNVTLSDRVPYGFKLLSPASALSNYTEALGPGKSLTLRYMIVPTSEGSFELPSPIAYYDFGTQLGITTEGNTAIVTVTAPPKGPPWLFIGIVVAVVASVAGAMVVLYKKGRLQPLIERLKRLFRKEEELLLPP